MDITADGLKTDGGNAMLKINLQQFANNDPEENNREQAAQAESDEKKPIGTAVDKQDQKKSSLPQTQEELDALINARLARERKNAARQKTQEEQEPENNAQPAQDTANAETAREMLIVRTQLEAYKSGQIRPECVEDAVDLAMAALSKSGKEATNEALKETLNAVLSRHPEWKADDMQRGGFKVGSDGEEDSARQQKTAETPNKKRWNRWQ